MVSGDLNLRKSQWLLKDEGHACGSVGGLVEAAGSIKGSMFQPAVLLRNLRP